MSPEELLPQLTALGLSRNEALAYLTLLEDNSGEGLTGYEVAARSGIPRSAVYTTLRKLEANGGAFPVGVDPVRYIGTDHRTFIDQTRQATLAQLQTLSSALDALPHRSRPEPVWTLQRYSEVMERAETMIRCAEHSVYLSVWPRELERLSDAIEAVAGRDLHRVLHSPTQMAEEPAGFSCWVDDLSGDLAKAGWSHKLAVIVDRSAVLIGGAEPKADNHAVWATNPSLVDLATNHIILDITLLSRKHGRDCVDVVAPMMRPHL